MEEIREEFGQPLVGDELVAAEVEGGGLDVRAVLNRGAHVFRKGRGEVFATALANALPRAVLGDFERDGREFEDLAGFESCFIFPGANPVGALRTGLPEAEAVLDDVVGMIDPAQGPAGVSALPSGLEA